MLFSRWIHTALMRRLPAGRRSGKPLPSRRFRPRVEHLEDRTVPSGITITVATTGGGSGSYDPGTQQATTLAAAITQANADDAGDTIVFKSGLAGPIDLSTFGRRRRNAHTQR